MDIPKRKPTRLEGYDYSSPGMYFITICTKDRKEVLSHIVGDGVPDVPQNILTEYGKIADKTLNQMNMFYDYITIEKYVIMPNHIHLILTIESSENGTSRTPSPTNSIVSKFISSFKRFCDREYGENIWQRSYYDHIIRGEEDYKEIWEYIDTNAIKWKEDKFFCEE